MSASRAGPVLFVPLYREITLTKGAPAAVIKPFPWRPIIRNERAFVRH